MGKTLKGMTLVEGIISMVLLLLAAGIMLSGFTAASKYAVRSINQKDTSAAAQYALNAVSSYLENGKEEPTALTEGLKLANEKYPNSVDVSSVIIDSGNAMINGNYVSGRYVTVTAVCQNDDSISVTYSKFIPDKQGDND